VGKRSESCYHHQTAPLFKDRHHYMHSNTSIQRQLTSWVWLNHTIWRCSKWGIVANHVTIIRSLNLSRIDYHYMHSNMSIQKQLTCWVWLNHTILWCSNWGKGASHVTIIRSIPLYALKYVHSNATYVLRMSQSHHFTV